MDLLEYQCRVEMDKLSIEQGSESRRSTSDMLECYWCQNMGEIPLQLPYWADVLQEIIGTEPASDAVRSDNPDQSTPNLTLDDDMASFKGAATAPTSVIPSSDTDPAIWLSSPTGKIYGVEVEKDEELTLFFKYAHQKLRTHNRHRSLPNLGTKSPARPRTKVLRAREKPISTVLKTGKIAPRPNLRTHSHNRPCLSVENRVAI